MIRDGNSCCNFEVNSTMWRFSISTTLMCKIESAGADCQTLESWKSCRDLSCSDNFTLDSSNTPNSVEFTKTVLDIFLEAFSIAMVVKLIWSHLKKVTAPRAVQFQSRHGATWDQNCRTSNRWPWLGSGGFLFFANEQQNHMDIWQKSLSMMTCCIFEAVAPYVHPALVRGLPQLELRRLAFRKHKTCVWPQRVLVMDDRLVGFYPRCFMGWSLAQICCLRSFSGLKARLAPKNLVVKVSLLPGVVSSIDTMGWKLMKIWSVHRQHWIQATPERRAAVGLTSSGGRPGAAGFDLVFSRVVWVLEHGTTSQSSDWFWILNFFLVFRNWDDFPTFDNHMFQMTKQTTNQISCQSRFVWSRLDCFGSIQAPEDLLAESLADVILDRLGGRPIWTWSIHRGETWILLMALRGSCIPCPRMVTFVTLLPKLKCLQWKTWV